MRTQSPRAIIRFVLAMAAAGTVGGPAARAVAQDEEPGAGGESEDKVFRFEFGAYGGGHFYAKKHGLRQFDSDPEGLSPKDAGAFGARLTMNFNAYVGIEGDGWWCPTRTRSDDPALSTNLSVFGYRA